MCWEDDHLMPAYMPPSHCSDRTNPYNDCSLTTCADDLCSKFRPLCMDLCEGCSEPILEINAFGVELHYPVVSAQSPGSPLILPATCSELSLTLSRVIIAV